MKFKQFIDDIVIDLSVFRNFANMKDIRKICNLIVNLLKFTFIKKILSNGLFLIPFF